MTSNKENQIQNALLSHLPSSEMYFRSYMHVDQVLFCACSEQYNFFMTMSVVGTLQFWHKTETDIEFVRKINTRDGPFNSYSVSHDGKYIATGSKNGRICIFDIISFDLITRYDYSVPSPVTVCFLHDRDVPIYELAFTFEDKNEINVINAFENVKKDENPEIIRKLNIHYSGITCMGLIDSLSCVISCDKEGLINFWKCDGKEPKFNYKMKLDTDLFIFAGKLTIVSIAISKNGKYFAACASDWNIYVFDIQNGKLIRVILENIDMDVENYGIEADDFNARVAADKQYKNNYTYFNAQFDESGKIIVVPSIFGIKFIDIKSGVLLRIIGRVEKHERYNSLAMLQSTEPPMLIATAFDRQRFYLYTNKSPESPKRDVYNEKASKEKLQQTVQQRKINPVKMSTIATLHTTMGSIKFEMFINECPLTVENFVTHARRGYYDNIRIHRVVRDFCIQTGDPTGTGIGGESIWGGTFEDEIPPNGHLFDKEGMIGMANSGKNTNGSQFFITTVPTPHLNGKHTCWGRVIEGMENIHMMELVDVDPYHHPKQEIKLINISFN